MAQEQKIYDYDNPLAARESVQVDEFMAKYNWQNIEVDDDFLNFAEPYRPPRYTLKRMDVPFANVGELHIISGKPGHGKTGLMSILIAAILSGKYGNTEYALSKERPNPTVLYIDTEQGKDDTIAFKNRVCTMANIDYTQAVSNFRILRLRDTESAEERWRKILKAVWMVKPTDIFLDGVLDVVKDYNDQVECQPIVRDCMRIADHFDSSFWVVLHENPMVEKLVGVLGSIFQRKVAEIFTIRKVRQCDLKPNERDLRLPNIYFIVKQVKARGRDVLDWMYHFVDASGWGLPEELNNPDEAPMDDQTESSERPSDEAVKNAVMVIKSDSVSYTTLRKRIMRESKCGPLRARYIVDIAVSQGYLIKDGDRYAAGSSLLADRMQFDEGEQPEKDPF